MKLLKQICMLKSLWTKGEFARREFPAVVHKVFICSLVQVKEHITDFISQHSQPVEVLRNKELLIWDLLNPNLTTLTFKLVGSILTGKRAHMRANLHTDYLVFTYFSYFSHSFARTHTQPHTCGQQWRVWRKQFAKLQGRGSKAVAPELMT